MSNNNLYAHEIRIVRAPGFEAGGFDIEDLCPGINIVYGPNASGKTTLGRCLQVLLWPAVGGSEILVGQFQLGEDEWRIDLDHGRCDYQRNGQVADAPELPSNDQCDRYWLSLVNLLQHETRNRSFAEAILQESAGGYDLSDAAEILDYKDSPITRGKKVVTDAERAIKAYNEARTNTEELRRDQESLPKLYQELEDIEEAQKELRLLEQAIDYAKARDELAEAQKALDAFPDVLERLEGGEAERIAEINANIQENIEERRDAFLQFHEAANQINDVNLPWDGLPEGFIDELEERQDCLERLETTTEELKRQLEGADTRCGNARREMPIQIDHEQLEQLEPVVWNELANFARQAEITYSKRKLYDAIQREFQRDTRPHEAQETLNQAREILENWLRSPAPSVEPNDYWLRIALQVLAGAFAGVGITLGLLIHPALLALIVLSIGPLWLVYRRPASSPQSDSRSACRDEFAELDLEPPQRWTVNGVRQRLKEIYQLIARHEVEDLREHSLNALTNEMEGLRSEEENLVEQREQLKSQFGLEFHQETDDIQLYALTQAISRWQKAYDDVIDLNSQIETTNEQISSALDTFNEKVSAYNCNPAADAGSAKRIIRELDTRSRKHKEAGESIDGAQQTTDNALGSYKQLVDECHTIVHRIGPNPDVYDQLSELCAEVEDYKKAKHDVYDDERILRRHEAPKLEKMPQYESHLKEASTESLKDRKGQVKAVADQRDDTLTEIYRINRDISNAKKQHNLQKALRDQEQALDQLADSLESDYGALVGHTLVEHLREHTSESHQPEVLQKASEVLATITRGRYRLDLADGDAEFRAYDTVNERGFALDELSSATRLQVLLAVRIAFIKCQEDGPQLPLVLDETLANTDDSKTEVIIDSMIQLAREGRQIFYLTAQRDEVAKWRSVLDKASDVDQHVVHLSSAQKVFDTEQSLDAADFSLPELEFPNPEEHDHASYGEVLGVSPLDPWQAPGSAHVWYLSDEPHLIHWLLSLGIRYWGQLKDTLERANPELVSRDRAKLAQLERQGTALEAFIHHSRKGRDRPIKREQLEASGAVSEQFMEHVTDLARQLNGNPRRLVEALRNREIEHFRHKKINELEAFLSDHGYLVDEEPLATNEIRRRMIERLHQTGSSEEEAIHSVNAFLSRINQV